MSADRIRAIRAMLEAMPADRPLRLMLAQLLVRVHDLPAALTEYRQLLLSGPLPAADLFTAARAAAASHDVPLLSLVLAACDADPTTHGPELDALHQLHQTLLPHQILPFKKPR